MNFFTFKILLLVLALKIEISAVADDFPSLPTPVASQEFFNMGTKFLAVTNLAKAEEMFVSAISVQDENFQPLAEYNLGHVRFAQGNELLKRGPDAQKILGQGNNALTAGASAIQAAHSALADNQLDKMLVAYIEGRGARKNLRGAEKVVRAAMENSGKTLAKWQRADDDFKGAAELNPADLNAPRNAAIVEQHIARLIDSLKNLQQMLAQIRGQNSELGKLLSQLKGQLPAPNAPPGGKGDDDDEDKNDGSGGHGDVTPESLLGKEEGNGSDGSQSLSPLSPEQAGQILDGLSIDGARRLPMISDKNGQPVSGRKGRIW
jgi:tetratricopeptide (TPR) repeat protein